MNATGDPLARILGYETNFTSFLIDPLYGQIGLNDMESMIIETKPFVRLRNIRQLGFASNVYPSATHRRFEHSIGTLHITWLLFKRFAKNYAQQEKWADPEVLNYFSDEVIQSLRLSALLHDLGHGPFSHALENIASSLNVKFNHDQITTYLLSGNIPTKNTSRIISSTLRKLLEKEEKLRKLRQFQNELTAEIYKNMRETILSILEEKYETKSVMPKGFGKIRYFLHDLVKGDIGSDRIDYLLRDTYFTGLGHRFNLSDLLENLRGIFDKKSQKLILAVDSRGREAVEFLLTTRYYHYRLIAHHPRNMLEQVKLLKRITAYRDERLRKDIKAMERHKETVTLFFKIALGEESAEKTLPLLTKNLKEVWFWELGAISLPWYRFLFYRVLEDDKLRQEYFKNIKKNICESFGCSLSEDEIHTEVVLEKPHIPALQQYQPLYEYRKKEEEDKDSPILHDYSTLISGLAHAYLSSTRLLLYAYEKYCEDVHKYTEKTHSFFLSEETFRKLLSKINEKNVNGHDLLLVTLFRLTDGGKRPFSGIKRVFEEVQSLQRKLSLNVYDFQKYRFYDPEGEIEFLYQMDILNDVLLFDFSRLIWINRVRQNVRPIGKPRFSITYNFIPMLAPNIKSGKPTSPLEKTLDFYPASIKDLIKF